MKNCIGIYNIVLNHRLRIVHFSCIIKTTILTIIINICNLGGEH